MKRNLLSILMVFFAIMVLGQKAPMTPGNENFVPSSRDNEFVCQPNSVFSQVAPALQNAYFCQAGYTWYLCADDYTASAAFYTLRIWGGDFMGCALAPTESFDIKIWDAEPWDGGNLVYSQTVNGTTSLTGVSYINTDMYQIDFNLGTTINQLNGWIGVTRNNASCYNGFAWAMFNYDPPTGNNVIFNGSWYSGGADMMFCLGGEAIPETPVSNWALLIGLGLIVSFTILRFRKI